ncbi:MAG TPA: SpoIID/LytB domain-containing protein [Pyrinomonadaceae bacterium]|nr:SpoIID/LytB domain-containing protein [Pyrinomonadaceae bacterium]
MSIHKQQTTAALLAATLLVGCLSFAPLSVRPQQRDRSVTANQQNEQSQAPEPVMRIALSTNTRAATISTAAQLLNASDFIGDPQPLETSRVRVESRVLSPQDQHDQDIEITLARALTREDADRLIKSVREVTEEEAKAVVDSGDRWRVVVVKQSLEDGQAAIEKLEAAGFDATLSSGKANENTKPSDSSGLTSGGAARPRATNSPSSAGANISSTRTNPPNRVRLTSRATAPNREVIAFAGGVSPLHSSAPLTFASSDEKSAPVRFNDKPYRGRIEVFANRRGSLTVVNVIGLEDYVKGVVPNELSFPALEALKAQAVAARTYALKNREQFASEGFDLLPTTRSQVYGGLTTETTLTTRAVDETRGVVATYNGQPINALYTSTCGGRTEDAENIFNDAVPYLRSRECTAELKAPFAPFAIHSSRSLFEIKDERDLSFARDVALLAVNGFNLPTGKMSSAWLADDLESDEARDWLSVVARLSKNTAHRPPSEDSIKAPSFSTALISAIFGEARADTLLNSADINYLLSFRDGEDVPAANRADVAMLIREGALTLFTDATLRPKEAMARGRALHAIARMLESRGSLALQKGTTRPTVNGALILRLTRSKEQPVVVSRDTFLFRQFGESLYQMKSVTLIGGEAVTFHVSSKGEVDYLEIKPATDGASAERFSPFTNWTTELSLGQVQARLARSARGAGAITDLRVVKRGSSRRATDLEVIGTQGTAHVRGGRIRSALGLREQLFVIDRVYGANDRVTGFVFVGRGWGHGVGMCQYGAYGLAKQGLNVDQILKAYYTGIDLTKLY